MLLDQAARVRRCSLHVIWKAPNNMSAKACCILFSCVDSKHHVDLKSTQAAFYSYSRAAPLAGVGCTSAHPAVAKHKSMPPGQVQKFSSLSFVQRTKLVRVVCADYQRILMAPGPGCCQQVGPVQFLTQNDSDPEACFVCAKNVLARMCHVGLERSDLSRQVLITYCTASWDFQLLPACVGHMSHLHNRP